MVKKKQFEVEYIVRHRGTGKCMQYFVHWRGYPSSDDSWVHSMDMHCPLLVDEYKNSLKKQKKEDNSTAVSTKSDAEEKSERRKSRSIVAEPKESVDTKKKAADGSPNKSVVPEQRNVSFDVRKKKTTEDSKKAKDVEERVNRKRSMEHEQRSVSVKKNRMTVDEKRRSTSAVSKKKSVEVEQKKALADDQDTQVDEERSRSIDPKKRLVLKLRLSKGGTVSRSPTAERVYLNALNDDSDSTTPSTTIIGRPSPSPTPSLSLYTDDEHEGTPSSADVSHLLPSSRSTSTTVPINKSGPTPATDVNAPNWREVVELENGFAKNMVPENIVTIMKKGEDELCIVKFRHSRILELIPTDIVRRLAPLLLIRKYEEMYKRREYEALYADSH